MAYVYSDLNTFSVSFACVRPGTKRIFCRCPRVDCNVFCIRGEQELKESISLTGYRQWMISDGAAQLSSSSSVPAVALVQQA